MMQFVSERSESHHKLSGLFRPIEQLMYLGPCAAHRDVPKSLLQAAIVPFG